MLQLAYLSASDQPTTPAVMTQLCEQASRNNRMSEVTGLLMARHGKFLQVLEGPREATEDTFLRIIADDRHHSLLLLSRKMVTRRAFGDWSMAEIDDVHEQNAMIAQVESLVRDAPQHLRMEFERSFG